MIMPYYDRDGIVIYNGCCLEVMPRLDQVFDAIICDLPYGTTACSWDTIIPFEPLWKNYKRLVKKNGAVILFGSQPFTSKLVISNFEWFRVEYIWKKPMGTNYLNANRDPMKNHENIIVFSESYPTYNPQMRKGKPYAATSGSVGGFIRDKTVGGFVTTNKGERYPLTVNEFNSPINKLHPTQKPLKLLEFLVKTYTDQNNIVLDNCVGSGTTAIACQNTNRRFVGIEKEEKYVEIAVKRIEDNRMRLESMLLKPWEDKVENKAEQLPLIGKE